MDNAAHTLSGLVVARMGPDRHGPFATALLVTAANFPDVDCVSLFLGGPTYLRWHHGITHSLLGVAVAGWLLALGFWWLANRRGHAVRLRTFVFLAYVGLLMHSFLDVLLSYGMRPFLPFDATWYYADVVFVADPWVWVILGVGAMLGGPRRGGGIRAWCVFAAVTITVVTVAHFGGRAPLHAAWVLALLWLVVLGLRVRGAGEGRRPAFARLSLVCVSVYFTFLLFMGRANHAVGVAELTKRFGLEGRVECTSTLPRAGAPWSSRIIVQTRDELFRVDVNGRTGELRGIARLRRNLRASGLLRLRGTRAWDTWRGFARHPFAGRLESEGAWILGDARYSWGVHESWCNLKVVDE
jgi:inner membrane protein